MKRLLLSFFAGCLLLPQLLLGQDQEKSYPEIYSTSGMEIIFSWASLQNGGANIDPILRFAPFFNFQSMVNYDVSSKLGFFSGVAVRNVGMIYDDPNNPGTRKKHRTYNIGVPVGIKIGKMNGGMVYGGYEVELPFHYKEKTIVNEVKDKFSVWFSNRVQTFQHGFLVGVQFPYGTNIKFKYYLSNFFNRNFREQGAPIEYPYQNFEANIFYVSLNFALFKNLDLYYTEE